MKNLPTEPTTEVAKQQLALFMTELLELWVANHGTFLAGLKFHYLAFPPGAYAPSKAGVVRDATAFEKGAGQVRWAFAMTDDTPPPDTPREYGLWTLKPDPSFFPDGV
ncbi:hypothetical protein RB608_24875 [Nocardioides sp. LHD-245]|uniref:hypothetical protein n=1 Tax=Nocardioides sp. LHD-245 TaxID=3051387 RepID=UPI0027E1D648|nr:hypothetical protein [Nocardioides sp. LHD-245]